MNSVNNEADLASYLAHNGKVFALFYSSWCPFCKGFLPVFEESAEGIGEILFVQVDDYDNPLWAEFCIESVPTVIFFENGKVSKRLDGRLGRGLTEREFNEWLRRL